VPFVSEVRVRLCEVYHELRKRGTSAAATTRGTMIRPISTEVALFLIPFAVYALFGGDPQRAARSCALAACAAAWLVIAALVLMLGSFVWFATFGGAPPDSTYIPAHVDENGTFVPGGRCRIQMTTRMESAAPATTTRLDVDWLRTENWRAFSRCLIVAARGARGRRRGA